MEHSRYIPFKTGSLYYRVYGSGKAVVLIHGFGEDGNIWNNLISILQNNYFVIVPDLPGSGRSSLLRTDTGEISMEDYATAVVHIIRHEAPGKCRVIGHSMGGYITLAIAKKFPRFLAGFGLFNSTAFADTEEKKAARAKSIAFLENNDAATFLKTSIAGLFAEKFRAGSADEIDKLIAAVSYFSTAALIQYSLAMMGRPNAIDVLQSTDVPVLFIIGENDPGIPLEKSLTQCHLPLVSHVHILPGVGHMAMLEAKELSSNMVLHYLDNC